MKSRASGNNVRIRRTQGSSGVSKKVAIAVGLVLVMVFMWGRLLLSGGSDVKEAKGNTIPEMPSFDSVESNLTFERVELPVVAGRNDVITHDMFKKGGWLSSNNNTVTVGSQSITNTDSNTQEKTIRQVAASLELSAIINGVNGASNEAFVDGELVSGGSKLRVKRLGKVYEFIVEDVMRDKVMLKWNEITIEIKMSEVNGVSGN